MCFLYKIYLYAFNITTYYCLTQRSLDYGSVWFEECLILQT
jgi:hypothetical protein